MGVKNWVHILSTCNPKEKEEMDVFSKFLLITRVCVLPMTWTSFLIGVLIAFIDGYMDVFKSILVFIGLTIAHMVNNLINDYFDVKHGVDIDNYIRGVYAPHPILSGLISIRGFKALVVLLNIIDFLIMVYLIYTVGWCVALFAVLGLFFSIFYVADPIQLKHIAMGELTVFLVWGPLMIGGTYYVITGIISFKIFLLSIPYGLLVTNVLIGKHIDKYDVDSAKGIKTLPVLIGVKRSKKLIKVLTWLSIITIVALVYFGYLTAWALLTLLAIPRVRTLSAILNFEKPKKEPYIIEGDLLTRIFGTKKLIKSIDFQSKEGNWPIWPLWYVAWAFWVNRAIGGLLILALFLHVLYPLSFNNLLGFFLMFFNKLKFL